MVSIVSPTLFLKKAFAKANFSRAVIALSGGVDSATSCALAVAALGKENIYPLLLPYGNMNTQGTKDARLVVQALKIPDEKVAEINIQPFVDPIFPLDPTMDNVRRGNIMARVRMTIIFDQAKKRNALVVGTENKTEHLLGYFTRFGDEASDIEPLRNLYKTQVYELAKQLGIPQPILTKAPTAGLWEGQTDEGEFGFTYKEADEILSLLVDEKKSIKEVVSAGFQQAIAQKIYDRMTANDFKHNLPVVPDSK
ncbi:NAD+ synthase [Candidatus Gottesmanbacteria bacterium]|nr:NAD+ synthase [Candidatus Gottesmanbacteria bacterium]